MHTLSAVKKHKKSAEKASILKTCPGFASGKSYSIGSFTAAPTGCDSEWNGFSIGGSASSITTSKTFTFSRNYISI